jgi:hypothetical protein
MKKRLFSLISLVAVSSLIFINLITLNQPLTAHANFQLANSAVQQVKDGVNNAASAPDIDLPDKSAEELAGNIINTLLAFLGVFFLILTIYAGFLWMTAGGDEKKTTQSRQILTNAVIGLLIIAVAYLLVNFVIFTLIKI